MAKHAYKVEGLAQNISTSIALGGRDQENAAREAIENSPSLVNVYRNDALERMATTDSYCKKPVTNVYSELYVKKLRRELFMNEKLTHEQIVDKLSQRQNRRTKKVRFADDIGKNLTSYAKRCCTPLSPDVKRSHVQNLLYNKIPKFDHGVFVESTLSNQNAIFGTLVVEDSEAAPTKNSLLVYYSWDGTNFRSVVPYFLGSNRYIFKICAPKKSKDDCGSSKTCKFYVKYRESRIDDNGECFKFDWTRTK